MSVQPFLGLPPAAQLHLLAALFAFGLGTWVLAMPKGTARHRLLGRVWMGLMAAVALSSFAIPAKLLAFGAGFGVIHLLSAFVLVAVAVAIWAARTGRVRVHRRWAIGLYAGALVGAGVGALVPGRVLSQMLGYG